MDKQFLDLKTRIENMSTEEFVQWMNEVFLNRNDHGYYCKIHEVDDDKYWSDYIRPIGAEIAIGIANGVEWGRFNRGERYVMYVEYDDNFITFDTKEQFFNEIWPLDDIIYEMNCRR